MRSMTKHFGTLALAAALVLCAGTSALAAAPDPLPPVEDAVHQLSDEALARLGGADALSAVTAEPSGEPTAEASNENDEDALPLVPGEYEGSDGSILTVKADGACTFETLVSGTVNGAPMSGRLTFHGTVDGGTFSFDKVTFYGLDLTKIAANAGYSDASYWEEAAGIIYAGAFR